MDLTTTIILVTTLIAMVVVAAVLVIGNFGRTDFLARLGEAIFYAAGVSLALGLLVAGIVYGVAPLFA